MSNYYEFIGLNPNIRFGKPCTNGTYIAVQEHFGLASGLTNNEILEDFPELTLDHSRAALAFATDSERRTGLIAT